MINIDWSELGLGCGPKSQGAVPEPIPATEKPTLPEPTGNLRGCYVCGYPMESLELRRAVQRERKRLPPKNYFIAMHRACYWAWVESNPI